MFVTVRFAATSTFPEDGECLATWETRQPPIPEDVVDLDGTCYRVVGRLWRGRGDCFCRVEAL